MRAIFGISAALSLLGAAACGGQAAQVGSSSILPAAPPPVAVEPHFEEGAGDIVEAPVSGSAAVAVRVLFYTGSIDDPPGKEGLTAVTARLMAEGGTKKLTYPEILRALYPMAVEIDVSVDKEQTVFSGTVHADHAARFIPLLADMIREPRLPEADFSRIRQDLINDVEKRLRSSDDEDLGKEMLGLMLYGPEHPYGHYDGGTVAGLRAITIEDVRAHAAKVFGRTRLLVGVGGAISEPTKASLRAAFAALPEGMPRVAQIPPAARFPRTEVLIAEKPMKAVAISIGAPHDAFRGHPDFSKLALVQSYFGEHRQFHGVLMNELRERRGLNYGDYAYVEKFIQEGGSRNALTNIARRRQHFEMWLRPVDPSDAVFSIRLALYLLDRLVRDGVPPSGIEDTRKFLLGYTRLWDITPSRRVGYALDDRFYGVKSYLESYRADLAKMTSEEVNASLRRHLVASPLKIAIVAPDAKALKAALLLSAPTEKKYDAQPPPGVLELDAQMKSFPLGLRDEDIRIVPADDLFVR